MNTVILIGRLVQNPELRYTQSAEPLVVCRFSVAVNRPYAKDGDIKADFINCVAFGRKGEVINQYFHKGSRIGIEGRLQVSNYTDQRGNKRYSTDVIVEDFEFCESKSEKNNAVSDNMPEASGFGAAEDVEEEDLPF